MNSNTLEISIVLAMITYAATDTNSLVSILRPSISCQPIPSETVPKSCNAVLCANNTTCKMVYTMGCTTGRALCEQYPVCLPADKTCDKVKCKTNEKCALREVWCITTPCYPQAICERSCPPNEQWRICPTMCEPTCMEQEKICIADCDPTPKCQCNFEFYRKNNETCVPAEQCYDSKTCANVKCASPNVCVMVNLEGCETNCTMYPRCVPPDTVCTSEYCPSDSKCIMQDVTCIRAPCWPVRTCTPSLHQCSDPNEVLFPRAKYCEPSCTTPHPICPGSGKSSKCQCRDGWYRHPNGTCVRDCTGVPIEVPIG